MHRNGKRYLIPADVLASVNGKLAQQSAKVKNNPTSHSGQGVKFTYGYARQGSARNYFGVRKFARNLLTNPYTPQEIAQKTLFTTSVGVVSTKFQTPAEKAKAKAMFDKQTEYKTLYGFAVAMTISNNGIWPFI